LALAAVVLAGVAAVWQLVAIGALLGLVGALDVPARQAFTAEIVQRRDDVGNAVALHAAITNAGRLIGPSLGGALVVWGGEGICFLANAVSYAPILAALLAMRVAPEWQAPQPHGGWGLRETPRHPGPVGALGPAPS